MSARRAPSADELIDDFRNPEGRSRLEARWRLVEDDWREVRLPFASFSPYRLSAPLDAGRLTQLGLVAIGRAIQARLCVAELGWYREHENDTAPSSCG